MKRIVIYMMALLLAVAAVGGDRPDRQIGLAVIKESLNPTRYDCSDFSPISVGQVDITRYSGEQEIFDRLNALNVGKRVADYLLGYDGLTMNAGRLMARIPEAQRTAPDNLDYTLAMVNNYVLVVKMNEVTKEKVLKNDTARLKPQGEWFLYQLDFTPEEVEKMKATVILPDDTPDQRGMKRVAYENLNVGLQLVGTGTDIRSHLPRKLARSLKYIDRKGAARNKRQRRIGSTSTALKIALSPFIILKR